MRPLTDAACAALTAGLRSSDAVTVRRRQIVLASARGDRPAAIAQRLGCSDQAVRNASHASRQRGRAGLAQGPARAHQAYPAFTPAGGARLREIIHQPPRVVGHASGVWTLALAAEVAHERRLTATRVSGETIRAPLERLGVRWRRATPWTTSPAPEDAEKDGGATG